MAGRLIHKIRSSRAKRSYKRTNKQIVNKDAKRRRKISRFKVKLAIVALIVVLWVLYLRG